jgi:hypothetical protein
MLTNKDGVEIRTRKVLLEFEASYLTETIIVHVEVQQQELVN